jgi:alkanesulfonate monooxygenase SsuD/methylene tetrahydromethanopterin reductase-like flavin-dependent oxidoreductase (luciferase family)
MQFGLMKLTRIPYADLQHDIQEAEDMGFDSAWIDDDLFTPTYADFGAWTVLPALAAQTERIRLGSLVTPPQFYHPAVLAMQVLAVDHISNGRIEVGVGAGGDPVSYAAVGAGNWPPRERIDRLAEQVAILARMLRGESVDMTGEYYASRVDLVIPPVQQPRPPLIVAAHGKRGLRLVARYADGWNTLVAMAGPGVDDPHAPHTLAEMVDRTRQLSQQLDQICVEEGRDPATIRRSVLSHRPKVEPLSSVDAFDEFTGAYEEIGIDEIMFYWPPLANTMPSDGPIGPLGRPADIPLSAEQRRAFEKVVSERISNR